MDPESFANTVIKIRNSLGSNHSSIPLMVVITVLRVSDGSYPSVKQIGLTIGCSLPMLTRYLAELRQNGFVELSSSESDRRLRQVIPTARLIEVARLAGLKV